MNDQTSAPGPLNDPRLLQMQQDVAYTLEHAIRVAVPKFFQTAFDGRFTGCIGCAEPLTGVSSYYIVKEARAGETIVEYAICHSCNLELDGQYSDASRLNIALLFAERVDFRANFLANRKPKPSWRNWVARCVLTGEPQTPKSEYQVVALGQGSHLLLSAWPYIISAAGLRLLEGCFSAQTREVRDRFVRQRLGMPSILSDHPAIRLRNPPP